MPCASTPTARPTTLTPADTARRNGALSKGPITEAGKARSARNAIRHGVCARTMAPIDAEDAAALAAARRHARPASPPDEAEAHWVEELVFVAWRQRRLRVLEDAVLTPEGRGRGGARPAIPRHPDPLPGRLDRDWRRAIEELAALRRGRSSMVDPTQLRWLADRLDQAQATPERDAPNCTNELSPACTNEPARARRRYRPHRTTRPRRARTNPDTPFRLCRSATQTSQPRPPFGPATATNDAALPPYSAGRLSAHQPAWRRRRSPRNPVDATRPGPRMIAACNREGQGPQMDARAKAASLAIWCRPVEPEPVGGGITNANFLVDDGQRRCFVRIGDDIPVHHILRWHELAASRAAMPPGSRPRCCTRSPACWCSTWSRAARWGRRTSASAGSWRGSCRCCAGATARCRATCAGRRLAFWVFHVLRDYAATLRAGSSRMAAAAAATCSPAPSDWSAPSARSSWCSATTTCSPANFIDDGERLWLVDWEYAGFNSPLFDLGGLASNSRAWPPAEPRVAARGLFRPRRSTTALRRRAAAMSAASLLREAMWSMVSELHSTHRPSTIVAYTAENLARFDAAPATPSGRCRHDRPDLPRSARDRHHRRRHRRLLDRLSSGASSAGPTCCCSSRAS